MVSEKTISEQYAHIQSLLEAKRLKEALTQLEAMLWQCPNWELRTRLEQLQTSYEYMLKYMREGVDDPARWNLYRKMVTDAWEVADQSRSLMLESVSPKYYYELRRTARQSSVQECSLKSLLQTLESFGDELAVSRLISEEKTLDVLKQHDKTLKSMFLTTWTNPAWTAEEAADAKEMLASRLLPREDLCLFVSAVMLSLMECFDLRKVSWLLDAYRHPDVNVAQRALVGSLIIFHMYQRRIAFYPELVRQVDAMVQEDNALNEDVACVYHQMLLCQETEKIDKKMREEIIPEVMKNISNVKDLRFDLEEGDEESDDKNPDWQDRLEQWGLGDKLREMNELQLEGADIYMSTFSSLKNFPFFHEVHNWFYPFSELQPDVFEAVGKAEKEGQALLTLVTHSGFFGNSDKYSLFFIISQLPSSQRNLIRSQLFEQQQEEVAEKTTSKTLKALNERAETVSNQYLHDLYRFFKLYVRRGEFRDIFKEKLTLHRIPIFRELLRWKDILFSIADFYLRKERWAEAVEMFEDLEGTEGYCGDNEFYQKHGYALQRSKRYADAIGAYLKADTLKPDNIWNNRHLATCYRMEKDYRKAIDYYKRVEDARQSDVSATFYIGSCLAETGQYEEALNYFFKLDFLEANSVRAWRGIGWCSFVGGKYEQAMKYYEKIIAYKPLSVDYMNIGHVTWVMGDVARAAVYYGKAMAGVSREQFLEMFKKDESTLLQQGIRQEDIPLMLDLL